MKEWRTVQIPEGLVNQIEEFIKTKEAQRLGISSISGYITYVIRKSFDE